MYIFVLLVRGHAQALLQVGASTEGIIALARDDQCSCAALAVLLVQALDDTIQLAQQLLRNSIAGLGTVKRQHGDGARVWSRDARDLEGSAQGRGVAALVVDGGLQPLSVGGDDAAAGEEAEHDCCMVGASNREKARPDKARWVLANQCNAWTSASGALRYVRQWNDKHQARVLAALPVLMITSPCRPHDISHWPAGILRCDCSPSRRCIYNTISSSRPCYLPSSSWHRRRRPALVRRALNDRSPLQPYQINNPLRNTQLLIPTKR